MIDNVQHFMQFPLTDQGRTVRLSVTFPPSNFPCGVQKPTGDLFISHSNILSERETGYK